MQSGRKPFSERAKIQLKHLKMLNRRYKTVHQSWGNYFRQMNSKIAELRETEAGLAGKGQSAELKVIQSQIRALQEILGQAREAHLSKRKK